MKEKEPIFKKGVPVIVKDRRTLYQLKDDPLRNNMRGLSKFDLWEMALSTPKFSDFYAYSGMCILRYAHDMIVILPEECLLNYDVAEAFKRVNGESHSDDFRRIYGYCKFASNKAAEIAENEYAEICKGIKWGHRFELIAKHIISIIQEFDLKDLQEKRTTTSLETYIENAEILHDYIYKSPVFLEKLTVMSIILYSRYCEKECDADFFSEIIDKMIERRRSSVYNVYYDRIENNMELSNFGYLECRINDRINKFTLTREFYLHSCFAYEASKDSLNDLLDIAFYGIMGLVSVCNQHEIALRTVDFFENNK